MGLAIFLWTTNQEAFGIETEDEYRQHSLSRTFCNLMCRPAVTNEEPELDQLGHLLGVDISPLYAMENYWVAEELEERLEFTDNEAEKQRLRERATADNAKLEDNLTTVLATVTQLLTRLASLPDLPTRFQPTTYDTLGREVYFSDREIDMGNGYIHDNFRQDLHHFKNFLDYAKSKGSHTVFFQYG